MEISRPAEYDVFIIKNVMVPMRDGVRMATDIYRPARNGEPIPEKLPVLLERTPYDKSESERVRMNGEYYASRGYVVVIQDVRGRYKSEGTFYFLKNEGEDGYDTVEWIARQPWCNGSVGTIGTSYMAWTQSSLAALNPPHLKAMFVNQGGSNAYTSTVRHMGAFEMRFLCWALGFQGPKSKEALEDPVIGKALGQVNMREWLTRMPLKRGCSPLHLIPNYEKWAFDIIARGDYDEFWKGVGFNIEEHYEQHADVPTYYSGGWYDSYTRATLENFVGLSKLKKQPIKVIMGPWTHGWKPIGLTYSGDVDFGLEAAIDYSALRLKWFDQWFKGMSTGVMDEPPIKIFVMGGGDGRKNGQGRMNHGGRWRYEHEWPLARTQYTPYYLHSSGRLSLEKPAAGDPPDSYLYDPRNPVPTIGGNMSSLAGLMPRPEGAREIPVEMREIDIIGIAGAFHQKEHPQFFGSKPPYLPLASRHDILVYETPPLEKDTEVTGPITIKLWASSSARDTDFTAKLIDVHPPNEDYSEGYDMNITDTIIRARYRKPKEKAELLFPNEIYPFTLILYPTSNLFKAGHRIRLDISSSNYPRFDVNPNTGDPLWANGKTVVAENTIYHDAARPSHIILPIIPKT
jgi:hypothetical protein